MKDAQNEPYGSLNERKLAALGTLKRSLLLQTFTQEF